MAEHTQSDIELVHSALRPLLMMLGDYRNLNPGLLRRLTCMISLFPTSFNEKMCDSLLVGGTVHHIAMSCVYVSVCMSLTFIFFLGFSLNKQKLMYKVLAPSIITTILIIVDLWRLWTHLCFRGWLPSASVLDTDFQF